MRRSARSLRRVGRSGRLLETAGRTPQSLFVEDESYYTIRATFSRAALIKPLTTQCEHEIVWLSATAAPNSQALACVCGAAGPKPYQ